MSDDNLTPAHSTPDFPSPDLPAPDLPARLPEGLTLDAVMDAALRQTFGLDNPGFCLACGLEADGCEPDAAGYPCEACGARAVHGAEAVFMAYC